MSADLLFEIGCEEIPAKMLASALAALPGQVVAKLAGARLAHGVVKALGTPRRIAVIVQSLADRQPDLDELVVGPPVGVAFAPDGSLSKAGEGFAKKNGVAPDAIAKQEVAGKKGLYAVAQKHVTGEATRALLPAILKELAAGIAWPKSMKWGWSEQTFVRPVQWLVALYGGEVVPFEWAGQIAGRQTRGHRFLSSGVHDLANAGAYIPVLRSAHVLVDPEERAGRVREELARLARENDLVMRPDEALVGEVIHLGEWPVGVTGHFDRAFLEVPEEMVITSMRLHQRYFAFEDAKGCLANSFATLAATHVKDPRVVASGNEKVLASRLKDAQFFFAEDKKHSLDDWNKTLDGVVFQAKLPKGAQTIGDKVRRIEAIATAAAGSGVAATAAKYCKADLASKAVGEFPELQGTMGKHYALHHSKGPEVADAIEQHWWPKGQGAELPRTQDAAIVALADKMDTIVGCFAVGLEPSGSADPFALRRAAIGIWQILLARPELSFAKLLATARDVLARNGVALKDPAKLEDYFRQRLHGIFVDADIPTQDANAALAQGWQDPSDARARAQACAKISKEAREVFKRVANILDDARAKKLEPGTAPDPKLFAHADNVEHALYAAIEQAQQRETQSRANRDYAAVFESLERLRPTVAAFFDKGGVMVMDPDPKLRDNRLALLHWFIAPYMAIADFRLLGGAQ
ncbi:MAG TPA: glycine--tRNA ligase subunit beta [Kofleriaceae bacterium]|nr:glycine--tRNA ligase subunit beta [Kofleriaceae bacterium]